jgi:hypothetical protein
MKLCSEVNDPAQVEAGTVHYFSPELTYHAFGKDEIIYGYEGLRIEILVSAFDFNALVTVTYKEKAERYDPNSTFVTSVLW